MNIDKAPKNIDEKGGCIEGSESIRLIPTLEPPAGPPDLRIIEGRRPRFFTVTARLETSVVVRFEHDDQETPIADRVLEAIAEAIPQAAAVNLDTIDEALVLFSIESDEVRVEEAAHV